MPKKTTRDASREESGHVAAYVQSRLREEDAKFGRGYVAKTAEAVGYSAPHISNAKNEGRMGRELMEALAAHWGMSFEEMKRVALGQQAAPDVSQASPEPTPPPAKSDTRRIATHYEDPQVEGYFASAIRHAPEEPTGKQIVTSKVFLREKMTKMVEGVDMVEFALGVIEAVQVLDKAGQLGEPEDPATHTVILAYLTAQSRARRTPREVALADARKRQLLEESANPEDDPPSAEPAKVAPRRKGGR